MKDLYNGEPQLSDEEVEALREKYKNPPILEEDSDFLKGMEPNAFEVTEKLAVVEYLHPDPDDLCGVLYEYIKDLPKIGYLQTKVLLGSIFPYKRGSCFPTFRSTIKTDDPAWIRSAHEEHIPRFGQNRSFKIR